MNLFTIFHEKIIQILKECQEIGELPKDLSLQKVTIESPKDPRFGDFSTNAAMVLASAAAQNRVILRLLL
jgi:arginyl-tRNA synthetase